jgi:ketosteroid isomerase-like protein
VSQSPGTDDPTAQLVQKLWDIEQIKQLKARYFRLIDTKDWEAWRDLFTDDCLHHLPQEANRPPTPNADYLEQVPQFLAGAMTVHHGHMPEITILSDTEAEGIWSMFDYVLMPGKPEGIKGYGHYEETYRKGADGRWRISSKRNTRIQLDQVPNTL